MKRRLVRFLVLLLLSPVALGGAFGHVDGTGALSHGTQLFHPDHPAHAPFVPEREHACASCAVANLTPPAFAPGFLSPPVLSAVRETPVERRAHALVLPELPGRSPPFPAA